MGREYIICFIVIILIILLNWGVQKYTRYSSISINKELKSFKELLKSEDDKRINDKINDIEDMWNKKYKTLAIFIEHDELEKIETYLVSLRGLIEIKDYKTGINELNKSIFILEHIADKYDFSIVNIF